MNVWVLLFSVNITLDEFHYKLGILILVYYMLFKEEESKVIKLWDVGASKVITPDVVFSILVNPLDNIVVSILLLISVISPR